MIYALVSIGCLECSRESYLLGVYPTWSKASYAKSVALAIGYKNDEAQSLTIIACADIDELPIKPTGDAAGEAK